MEDMKSLMTISEVKTNRINPFETENIKLIKLFSFFLHFAPTINSSLATTIPESRLNNNWIVFLQKFNQSSYKIIPDNCKIENYLNEYHLNDNSTIKRTTRGFICKRKSQEKDYECILRHIRNSIAHANVFMSNVGNRKYILFEDFNPDKNKNKNAIILFSQTDLNNLKKIIIK